jgi:hypothetical protein
MLFRVALELNDAAAEVLGWKFSFVSVIDTIN